MLSIFKETTVHTFKLAFSAPFVRVILLHNLFFPPFGVTRADDHITSHPWGQGRTECGAPGALAPGATKRGRKIGF